MKLSEATPFKIQVAITEREHIEKARALASAEKPLNDTLDGFYSSRSTDNTINYDKQEINAYMELS